MSHLKRWLEGGSVDSKDIVKIPTSELVIELLHRKEIDAIFLENNDNAFIDTSHIKGYTNEDNRYIEDAALILIYKD